MSRVAGIGRSPNGSVRRGNSLSDSTRREDGRGGSGGSSNAGNGAGRQAGLGQASGDVRDSPVSHGVGEEVDERVVSSGGRINGENHAIDSAMVRLTTIEPERLGLMHDISE